MGNGSGSTPDFHSINKYLLCARHQAREWDTDMNKTGTVWPRGACSLVAKSDLNQLTQINIELQTVLNCLKGKDKAL